MVEEEAEGAAHSEDCDLEVREQAVAEDKECLALYFAFRAAIAHVICWLNIED